MPEKKPTDEYEFLLVFTETNWFKNDWHDLGLGDEDDISLLQYTIMSDPERHPVVAGTGGLRKMRFSPPSWNIGKSGALRVCYAYYKKYSHILLAMVYPKTYQENLTADEKAAVHGLIDQHGELLSKRYARLD